MPLLRAQVLNNILEVLRDQTDLTLISAAFQSLQWLLAGGAKSIWIEDDDDTDPLFSGEVREYE